MKKQKVVKPFFFKDKTHQDIILEVNKSLPIYFKDHEDIINRIHKKYPLISKSDISLIVIAIFESIRELLILGKVLNFNKIFFDTKFYFFDHSRDGAIFPSLKLKMSTPPPLKKYDAE